MTAWQPRLFALLFISQWCSVCGHHAGLTDALLGSGSWQLGDQGTKLMKTIKASSTHLSTLINDILDAAAAGKGKLAIKLEKVSTLRTVRMLICQHAEVAILPFKGCFVLMIMSEPYSDAFVMILMTMWIRPCSNHQ